MTKIDYVLANASARRFKSALTRSVNKGDHKRTIQVANECFAFFDERGWPYPDRWHVWQIAKDDAMLVLSRKG